MLTEKSSAVSPNRVIVLALLMTFAVAVVVSQLFRYQVARHPEIVDRANDQFHHVIVLSDIRGPIVDRHGHILAMDLVQWDISVDTPFVTDPETLASQLAPLLNLPEQELYAMLISDQPWVRLARGVPQDVGEAIIDLNASGLIIEARAYRVYPEGDLVTPLLGIVNESGGHHGIEGYYDHDLSPIAGKRETDLQPDGREIPKSPHNEEPPREGSALVLTLDLNIQYIVDEELHNAMEKYEAEGGTIIVMDPRTGAILASVSYPTYDPHRLTDKNVKLLADPAVSSVWEPGSIFKVVTYAAGLDAGTITPETPFLDNGRLEVGGRIIRNFDNRRWGRMTLKEALAHSLNTAAAYVSTSLGKNAFYTYVRRFGLGDLTGVDLAGEAEGMVKLPGDSNWFPSELGINAFGQGIAVTPVQMISAAAAIANDGLLMKPYIVHKRIIPGEAGEAERVVETKPVAVRRAISSEAASTLTAMLVRVVEDSAFRARVPGYRIAGKTGTAQIPTALGYHKTDTIQSFVGYAPADDPQFIILVKLNKPKTSPWSSHTAAPTFRAITERLLVYLQIPPDDIRLAHSQGKP
jgi:cell division protein FtsI/penicillin-binding protein 2